jgi:tetratricopeptide (TPR) repeat protein
MKKITLVYLLIIFSPITNSFSQTDHTKDSLLIFLKTSKADTNKIKQYLNLGDQYVYTEPDTALFYYSKALTISEEIKAELLIAKCLNYIGLNYQDKSSYDKALPYLLKSLKIREEKGDKKGMAGSYNNIGNNHLKQGAYDKALEYFLRALKLNEETGNKNWMAINYNNIGLVYIEQGAYTKAISYNLKSLKIKEELGDQRGIGMSYNNIGNIHLEQGSYDKAQSYYFKAIKIYKELGDKRGESGTYTNIGNVYKSQGSNDKALSYFLKALKIAEEVGDQKGIANIYNNFGVIYQDQHAYEKAKSYFFKALQITEELGDKNGMALNYGNIAGINIKLADSSATTKEQRIEYLNNAILYGNKTYELAKKIGAMLWEKSAANHLMYAYTKSGNYKKAIEFAEIYIVAKDSLFNEDKTKELAGLEAKYKYEKQKGIDDVENEKLVAIEKVAKAKQKIITYATAGGLGLVAIFSIFVFNRLQVTKKQKHIITHQKHLVEEKHKEITDSINYAERIQGTLQTY